MKILLDSNVLIAAFATRGLCHTLFEQSIYRHEVISSREIPAEVAKNLKKKLKLPQNLVEETVSYIEESATLIVPQPLNQKPCRDPNDVHVPNLALTAGCDYLVTGDDDLLTLKKIEDIPIVSPRTFWPILRSSVTIDK
ncbi:MAG: putative toxin-antitoxin system toxin component, PIN family [Deltaproteobacteria bacterium]|nr:putative toxin-antitoxin system toxin component, PIN family [Deltaproteobacteria bacterium]